MQVSSEMRSVLDATERSSLIVRKDFTVAYANRSFRERYGYFSVEGRYCHELIFHDALPCTKRGRQCPVEIASLTGKSCCCSHQILGTMGTRHVETSAQPIRKADGEAVAYVVKINERRSKDQLTLDRNVVTYSKSTQRLLSLLAHLAVEDVPVLLLGESGVGKGVFAKLLHENSRQAARPFIRLYAGELSVQKWERMLVGREEQSGLLDSAFGGTILIRHVHRLSIRMQHTIGRMVTSGRYVPREQVKEFSVPFRLMFTSDLTWGELYIQKKIVPSFFFALSAYAVTIPALRERKEDIRGLIRIIFECSGWSDKYAFSSEAHQYILTQFWRGNCEELFAVVRRVCWKKSDNQQISLQEIQQAHARIKGNNISTKNERLSNIEFSSLVQAWQGTRVELAKNLGISERTLYRLLNKLKN